MFCVNMYVYVFSLLKISILNIDVFYYIIILLCNESLIDNIIIFIIYMDFKL